MSADASLVEIRDVVFEASGKSATVFVFADFVLDLRLYQLQRHGGAIPMAPKNFDLLVHLIRHRDRVLTKRELLEGLWAGECVSESVLPRCIHEIRRALGDPSHQSRYVETVRGRGYRFIGRVRSEQGCPWCGQTLERRRLARQREANTKQMRSLS